MREKAINEFTQWLSAGPPAQLAAELAPAAAPAHFDTTLGKPFPSNATAIRETDLETQSHTTHQTLRHSILPSQLAVPWAGLAAAEPR